MPVTIRDMNPIPYSRERLASLPLGCTAVAGSAAIFIIAGPGAVTCLQGLVTADVAGTAPDRSCYGAMLTPKGMIIADYWIGRVAEECLLIGDPGAREPTAAGFARQLPPRLAKATDHSADWRVLWLLGTRPAGVADLPIPDPGHAARLDGPFGPAWVVGGPDRSHFAAVFAGTAEALAPIERALLAAGVASGTAADLRAGRILAGVPSLGDDIDDRTLPQEAGFDDLSGVSYSKGCYVGQETVARLHFRGHPNWVLRRIEAPSGTDLPAIVTGADGKPAMKPGSLLVLEDGSVRGLARVRREVSPGDLVGGVRILETTEPRP